MDTPLPDDISPLLTPRTADILRKFKTCKSMAQFRARHPEVTEAEMDQVTAEVMELAKNAGLETTDAPEPPKRGRKSKALKKYRLKITLKGSKPPIWRRFEVPSNIPLDWLHAVIQVVMGWTDSHLHEFVIGGERFSARFPDDDFDELDALDEAEYELDGSSVREKAKFTYTYDFGDGWEHVIAVEKVLPQTDARASAVCLAGKGNCPPEDCGGIWGFYHRLEILKNPDREEYEETREWMGNYDPDAFDLDDINRRLKKLFESAR